MLAITVSLSNIATIFESIDTSYRQQILNPANMWGLNTIAVSLQHLDIMFPFSPTPKDIDTCFSTLINKVIFVLSTPSNMLGYFTKCIHYCHLSSWCTWPRESLLQYVVCSVSVTSPLYMSYTNWINLIKHSLSVLSNCEKKY